MPIQSIQSIQQLITALEESTKDHPVNRNTDTHLTEQLYGIWKKCADDFDYFLHTYIFIDHCVNGINRVERTPASTTMAYAARGSEHVIIEGCRQSGKTVIANARALHQAIFKSCTNTLMVMTNSTSISHSRQQIQGMYKLLPNWMKPGISENNKNIMSFDNESRILFRVRNTNSNTYRGQSFNFVVIDEIDFWTIQQQSDFFTGVLPAFAPTGKILITTCFGSKNKLDIIHNIQANALEYGWKILKIPYQFTSLTNEQALNIKRMLGEERFRQEYSGDFNTEQKQKQNSNTDEELDMIQEVGLIMRRMANG